MVATNWLEVGTLLNLLNKNNPPGSDIKRQGVFLDRFLDFLLPAFLLVTLWPLAQRLDFFLATIQQRLTYPFFQTGSEGLILSEVALIRGGSSIYVPFRADQFISAPYPPLYYYLAAWLGAGQAGQALPFTLGRIISLVSAGIIAAAIAWLIVTALPAEKFSSWRKVIPIWVGLLSGLIFLSLPAVAVWAVRMRADMLMTALQLVGLGLVAAATYTRRDWLAFGAVLPFALAFFTKQTALAAPVAAAVYLALYFGVNWKKTLAWLVSLGLAIGLPFLVLNWLTGNELYRRLFKYHNLPWLSTNFESYLSLFWQENAALLLLGSGLLGLSCFSVGLKLWPSNAEFKKFKLQRAFEALQSIPLVSWYWLVSLALLGGLGVSGADHNHFLPAEAANCLVGGVLFMRLLILPKGWRYLTLLAVVGFWAQAAFFSVPTSRYEIEFRQRDAAYQTQMAKIIAYATNAPGAILTNEAGFFVLSGRGLQTENYYNDLFTLTALHKQSLYSQDGLLERVRRKEFGLVLAPTDILDGTARPDVWSPELIAALRENYYRKFADVWYVFEPKP